MKKYIKFFGFSIVGILLLNISCKRSSNSMKEISKSSKDYEYRREIISYDKGNNIFKDIEIYISQTNDTIGYQVITYNNDIIDSAKSRFYKLNLYREKETNLFGGRLTYYYDSLSDGKLVHFKFSAVRDYNKETDVVEFNNYDFKNNSLKFLFEHDNDTLMGLIYAQHVKDTIENVEEKARIREVLLAVDNHNETDNPFVKIKLE